MNSMFLTLKKSGILLAKTGVVLRLHFYFYFLTYSDNEHLLFVYFFQMNNAFALFPLLIEQ